MNQTFDAVYQQSINDPEGFWAEAASEIDWITPWKLVLDKTNPPHSRWFQGGQLNTCYNCIDRHVIAGNGKQNAVIYDSPVTQTKKNITYSELLSQTALFSGVLASKGVVKGDRVILYMPMIPEAIVATMACARLGAIHVIVFGGFAANELAVRIDDCKPKVIVTASCGIEPNRLISYKPLLDEAIKISAHQPSASIVLQRPQKKANMHASHDFDWENEMLVAKPQDCVPVYATDPLYILYTSGTTGQPKGVVRDNGGHAVALKWSMKNIYDVKPGDIYWAASDVGWVVGHSYIMYATLLHGCTTVLYEGKPVGTPDPGAFWRVISEHDVNTLFTAPTAIRAIRQQDPEGTHIRKYDLSNLKALFLAGERCDPDTLIWSQNHLKVPVIDHWWQTETGWAIAANCLGIERLPVVPGSPTRPCPGWNVRILNDEGMEVAPQEIGNICIKMPLPPSTFHTLWNADNRYRNAYFSKFPGYYETGDAGMTDENGYIYIMARTDDVINVAGHRLSTGAIEEILASHPSVAECAVIGEKNQLKGQVPIGFVVLNADSQQMSKYDIANECMRLVRKKLGPVASYKFTTIVKQLPKTRSGKILRSTIKKIADGEKYKIPATIEDASVLPEITEALKKFKSQTESKT